MSDTHAIIMRRLRDEQQEVEAQIRDAFRGVTREHGVSWSETFVIDNSGSDGERFEARAKDIEQSWEELVDDPNWQHEPGVGGFNFLDPIGFRYYIAAAMVRCARTGYGEWVGYALMVDGDYRLEQISRMNRKQAAAIARFVRFMIATHSAVEINGEDWKRAYKMYWRQYDTGNPAV